MITCTLGDKKYSVDFVSGRALREIGPAAQMYARIVRTTNAALHGETVEDDIPLADALDVMVKWFCQLFGNQFTADDMYDHYPADRIIHDMSLAIVAVQSQTSEVLSEFPTKAAETTAKTAR